MDLEYILRSIPKQPVRRDYMVHIDDLVSLARILRKDGYAIVRRYDSAGMKYSIFDVYAKHEHGLLHQFTLYVDEWRAMKRGTVIIMPEVNLHRRTITFGDAGLPDYRLRRRFNE